MLLQGKAAVIYGAAGHIGTAVARAFAREGARLFLTGRTLESVEMVAHEVRGSGGVVEAAKVDALDRGAIDAHLDDVVRKGGASTFRST